MDIKIKIEAGKTILMLDKLENNVTRNLPVILRRILLALRGKVAIALGAGTYGIKTRGGRLAGTMDTNVNVSGTAFEGTLGPTVKYGPIQETGGTIYPKSASVLHFYIDGKEVFAKSVVIPPHWYMRNTLKKYKEQIPIWFNREIMKL